MFWYKLKNENASTCQNTDWFQFWLSNMAINAKKNSEVNQSKRTCYLVT